MNPRLQELLESKIKVYEKIISEIKDVDYELIAEFYPEFEKLEKIDRTINDDPALTTERVMKIKL